MRMGESERAREGAQEAHELCELTVRVARRDGCQGCW